MERREENINEVAAKTAKNTVRLNDTDHGADDDRRQCISRLCNSSNTQASLTSPQSGQVFQPGSSIEIAGTAQGVSEVSITVRNEQGTLVFTAQPQVEDGRFVTGFTLDSDAVEGEYTLTLSGLGLSVKKCKFTVLSAVTEVSLQSPSSGQEFKAGDVVEITGTATRVSQVAVSVRNSQNGRVYVAQPSVTLGQFTTMFTLAADAMAGQYTIAITGSGLDAAQTCNFEVTSTSDSEDDEDNGGGGSSGDDDETESDAILFINGNGVSNEVSFTRAELEEMTQERILYSTTSDMPQDKPLAAEGVLLQDLLDEAGMKSGAKMITFEGNDGYDMDFTVDELLNTTRYRFSGSSKTEVEPLIALKRVEGSSSFDEMKTTDTPVLCYGQRAKTEQTLPGFVSRMKYITVTTSSPGQWAEPVAKIITPDTTSKVTTQGGEVDKGSEVYLETELSSVIYYTTDGTTPNLDSEIFNKHGCGPQQGEVDPIVINATTTVKAYAVGRGKRNSDVLTLTFTIPSSSSSVSQQVVSEENIKKEAITLADGRTGEKLTFLEGGLADIDNGEQGSRLTVTSTAAVDQVTAEFPVAALLKAKEKGMLLGINSTVGDYTLPLAGLNLDEIAAGLSVKPEELSMNIVVSKTTGDVQDKLAARVREGQEMLADPVEFTIEITAPNGKKVEFKSFGGQYVERELALNGDVNAEQSTGVVWNEAKNQFRPVPTRFTNRDGINYAVILNRTNSIYTVLQSDKTFDDIQENWAKEDIELLTGKLLIDGKTETAYEPGSNITRAEFATLLVRALGLEEGVLKEGQFKDVADTDWYAGSVAAATAENIINGYD